MNHPKVIIAVNKSRFRDELVMQFYHAGLVVKIASSEKQILHLVNSDEKSVLLTQMNLLHSDAIELLLELRDRHLNLPVAILVQDGQQSESVISHLHVDAVWKEPFPVQQIVNTVTRLAMGCLSTN